MISSLAVVSLTMSLVKQYSLLKAIQDFGLKGTSMFDADNFPGFQVGDKKILAWKK